MPSLKNVPLQSRWVTETVRQEVSEKSGAEALAMLDRSFRTLSFNDLYEHEPRACPVFYWYVLAMYNPATVGSWSFIDDQFESKLQSKISLNIIYPKYLFKHNYHPKISF